MVGLGNGEMKLHRSWFPYGYDLDSVLTIKQAIQSEEPTALPL
jgi:hypothetical protein